MPGKLLLALAAYATFAVLAWFTLEEPKIRWATLLFLAGFAAKTAIAIRKDRP